MFVEVIYFLDDHFAYVQGEYGAPSKGSLESPEIFPGKQKKVFKFAYWKTASTPILDVSLCLHVPFLRYF
jgi:hypothetical protein